MNENLDLTTILKDCPKGTKLYSTIYGDVFFESMDNSYFPICVKWEVDVRTICVTREGQHLLGHGECTLFPSRDQRDWSMFKVPIEKFDINTIQPFDKVLVRNYDGFWEASFFSHKEGKIVNTVNGYCRECIPYNDDTKYLVGSKEDCPEYYKWWKK